MTDEIASVRGRRVWDSRGRPTVEVEILTASGRTGRAIAPAGASRGSREAVDRRDGGQALGGWDVRTTVAAIDAEIAPLLLGRDPLDQGGIDNALIELDGTPEKRRLGGNALVATSMAVLHTAAASRGVPLWRHLAEIAGVRPTLPLPEIQIFGGGAHAERRTDVQDFMVMPGGATSFAEGLDWVAAIYLAAGRLLDRLGRRAGVADEGGWWPMFDSNEHALELLTRSIEEAGFVPGEQVAISLDIASSEFGSNGRYRLGLDRRELDADGWGEILLGWVERFPIRSIEDPFAEDDDEGLAWFTKAVGDRVQIVADDYTVTSAARVQHAVERGACNCLLVKPNQAGTITEARAAFEAARAAGWDTIVSARSGETEDVTISHLAVGWAAGQLKVGSFARSERMAKWNEVLRIEETLRDDRSFDARYCGWSSR